MLRLNINPAQQRATDRLLTSINNKIVPVIGHLSATELKRRHFIELLKIIEEKGLAEVASCLQKQLSNIMCHAVYQEFIDTNPQQTLWA